MSTQQIARATAQFVLLGSLLHGCGQPQQADSGAPPAASLSPGWNEFKPGGATMCSDGSEYRFYARPGNSDKLLVYLQGGGGCWMRSNCDESLAPSYRIRLGDFHPDSAGGIFEFDNPANPFADYNVVFAPYCTGDAHLGASDTVYPPSTTDATAGNGEALTVHHQGVANVQSVLAYAYQNFATPTEVFVTGSSAGAIPSPYYAVQVAEHYPMARVTQLGDGAGGYRQTDEFTLPHKTWKTIEVLNQHPAWENETADTFNYERIYIGAAGRLPQVQFAEYDTAEDSVQLDFLKLMGSSVTSLQGNLVANYADIRAHASNFVSYMAGGDLHTILRRPEFYTYTAAGVSVRDWVANLAAGAAVADVACTDCRLPEFTGLPMAEALKTLWLQWESPEQAVEPFQIFDNLYYVGIDWVAAYVLETSEGLILIDSLYGKWIDPMLANMAKLGLDPNDIKYVLLTHGHFDHHGGAGVLSMRYQVRDGDDVHEAITLGGVGLNFSGVARTEQYLASYARLQSQANGISVSLPNHAAMGRVFERRDRLAARQPGEPHPFVDAAAYTAALEEFIANANTKLADEKAGTAGYESSSRRLLVE